MSEQIYFLFLVLIAICSFIYVLKKINILNFCKIKPPTLLRSALKNIINYKKSIEFKYKIVNSKLMKEMKKIKKQKQYHMNRVKKISQIIYEREFAYITYIDNIKDDYRFKTNKLLLNNSIKSHIIKNIKNEMFQKDKEIEILNKYIGKIKSENSKEEISKTIYDISSDKEFTKVYDNEMLCELEKIYKNDKILSQNKSTSDLYLKTLEMKRRMIVRDAASAGYIRLLKNDLYKVKKSMNDLNKANKKTYDKNMGNFSKSLSTLKIDNNYDKYKITVRRSHSYNAVLSGSISEIDSQDKSEIKSIVELKHTQSNSDLQIKLGKKKKRKNSDKIKKDSKAHIRKKLFNTELRDKIFSDKKKCRNIFNILILSDHDIISTLEKISDTELCKEMLLLINSINSTPLWLECYRQECMRVIYDKAKKSKFIQQRIFFIQKTEQNKKSYIFAIKGDSSSAKIYKELFKSKRKAGFTYKIDDIANIYHPFESILISKLRVEKVFSSNNRPLLVKIWPKDKHDKLDTQLIIFKQGDDLRRDMAVMSMFKLMNMLWESEDYVSKYGSAQAYVYDVAAIGKLFGAITYIPNCIPVQELKKYQKTFSEKQKQLQINTAAGGTIASFLLGIKDRHDDNTLIAPNGCMFQIDFSYMLGQKVTVDTAEISITRDTKRHFGKKGWEEFIEACLRAFCTIRKHDELIIKFGILTLGGLFSPERVASYLHSTLMLDYPVSIAKKYLKSMLEKAPSSYRTRFKNVLHHTAQAFSKKENTNSKANPRHSQK